MKGVVWGSSCSIWWQNTDLENFVRENSEVWLTYYFYWLWSFKVYNNAYVDEFMYMFGKPDFFYSFHDVQFYQIFYSDVRHTYMLIQWHPVDVVRMNGMHKLRLFHWLEWISTLCLVLLIPKILFLSRLPEKIGGKLPGVHYIRDVADADSLVSSLVCSVD